VIKRRIPKILIKPREVEKTSGVSRQPMKTIRPIKSRVQNVKPITDKFTKFILPKRNSNRLFIIAGGPSIKTLDLSLLKGEDTLCVNAAVEVVPNPTYFVTLDYSYLSKGVSTIDSINRKISGESFFILKENNPNLKEIDGIVTDTRHNFKYEHLNKFTKVITSKADTDPMGFGKNIDSFVNGNNSGFSAIQLGLLLGYEEVYLIGFDLGLGKGGESHFHSWYGDKSNLKSKIVDYKNILMSAMRLYSISKRKPIIKTITESPLETYIPRIDLRKVMEIPKKETESQSSFIIVAYYTINTPYEQEANKLKASLDKLKVSYDIVGVENLGNWQANTRFKARFMQDMLDKHKGKNLVYVDSDAVIHQYPTLFDNYPYDIAVRWQDFRWRKNECLSGTIFMANNQATRELCKRWEGVNVSEGPGAKTFEQWNLGKVIEDMRREGKVKDGNLPPEYTMIFDSMREMYPNINPVIEHFQASRKLRNKV
jgi:hypothetical protein